MKRKISVGGLDRGAFFAEKLALPVLDDVESMIWITDALDQAASERKGVAVVGDKGAGKTVALKHVLDDFDNAEREAVSVDAKHDRRRIVLVHSPRSNTRREILSVIWKAVLGMELRPLVRGRKKPIDLILEELVEQLLQQHVAVLAFDEAEYLTDQALSVIRDVISLAETRSQERYSSDDYRPAGVGALLVGTPDLEKRLSATEEAGHRWIRIQQVEGLEPDQAADVYVKFLPGFQSHVDSVGKREWKKFIRVHVARGRRVPIRLIENHVRNYARRTVADQPEISEVSEIEFEDELFDFTLKELASQRNGDD